MSEKCTVIHLPGSEWGGLLERGEKDIKSMLKEAKRYAEHEVKIHQQVLDAKPEDFDIEVVRGIYVQHHVRTLQKSARP